MNENPENDFYSPPYYNEAGMLCYIPTGREDGLPIPLCTFAPRIVKELIVDDGEKTVRHYLIGGTDPDGEEIEPVDVPANDLEKMHWIADNLDASCDLCIVPQVEKHVRYAIKSTARYAEKQYIFSHTGWKKIQGEWHFLMPEYDKECFVEEEILKNLFAEHFPKFREGWRDDLKEKNIPFHNRLPDTLAWLELGFTNFTRFLFKMSIIDEDTMKGLWIRMQAVLLNLATKQSESVEADRPTHIFLRKLYSLIECGKVCLVPMNGTAATTPKNYIGYEDDTYYYLMLDVSHKAVKQLCGEQDEGFAISAKSLAKALADEGLIEVKNGVNTHPVRFGGKQKRVMMLSKEKANKVVSG